MLRLANVVNCLYAIATYFMHCLSLKSFDVCDYNKFYYSSDGNKYILYRIMMYKME